MRLSSPVPVLRRLLSACAGGLWSLRWALVSLPGPVRAVTAALVVLVPAVVVAAVTLGVDDGPGPGAAPTPAGPPVATPAPADSVGIKWGSPVLDGPRCKTARARLTELAAGTTAKDVSAQVREEVGFQAAAVGRFCTPKQAAKANRDLIVPFYATS